MDEKTGPDPVIAPQPRFTPTGAVAVPQFSKHVVMAAIQECMFVVRPGETLVVRMPPYIQPRQVQEYQDRVDQMVGDTGTRVLFLTGDEFGILGRGEEADLLAEASRALEKLDEGGT